MTSAVSEKAIVDCKALQSTMNEIVFKDWATRGFNWELASTVEAAEAIGHVTFKWWKAETSNWEQAFIEIVDIFHFLLSKSLEKNDQNNIAYSLELGAQSVDFGLVQKRDSVNKALLAFIHELTKPAATDWELNLVECYWHVGKITALMGKSLKDLISSYIQKNVLNVFRQHNGYKEGTYIKMWKGKEDNEVLYELVQANPVLAIDAKALYQALKDAYPSGAR